LSRHKFNEINDELTAIWSNSKAAQSLYKKMLSDFMMQCFFSIEQPESEKLFEDIQNQKL